MIPLTPCKECTKRNVHCHNDCKDYLDWKDVLNKHNAQIHKVKLAEKTAEDYKFNAIKKIRKGTHK